MEVSNKQFWPSRIFVSENALEDEITKRVLSRLPDAEKIILAERSDPLSELNYAPENTSAEDLFTLGKKSLLLTRHLGSWIEHCPAGSNDDVCCNLWTVNPGEGCPMDCTYCYLQSYLQRNPTLKLFTNVADMLGEIEKLTAKDSSRLYRIGTGEVIDSLVWDELSDLSCELVPFFGKRNNLLLELKSKHDYVDNLVDMKALHAGNTVVSWSMNAKTIVEKDEKFTANLSQRIAAAAKCVDAGYRVGFHFDPLVYFDGFEDEYRDCIRAIFESIDAKRVAWVGIGTLRYRREMQEIMRKRFKDSKLPFAENYLGAGNKLRYFQPIRLKLINFVWRELKSIRSDLPVFMCMENSAAWRTIAGQAPAQDDSLAEVATRSGRLAIIQDNLNV